MPPELRLLRADELAGAARQHRLGIALIPGATPRSAGEAESVYGAAFGRGPIWGAFEGDTLIGHLALEPGWIEHLYVEPDRQGQGIGRALVTLAQREQAELRLFTYQANGRARRLYERAGFAAEAFGADPETGAANVRYHWQRQELA